RGVLRVLPGRHAEVALGDPRLVVEDVVRHAPPVVEDLDVRVLDELEGIAVAGDDDDVEPSGRPLRGQRGDDVVGLDALDAQLGHLHRLQHLPDEGHLGGEEVAGPPGRAGPDGRGAAPLRRRRLTGQPRRTASASSACLAMSISEAISASSVPSAPITNVARRLNSGPGRLTPYWRATARSGS